MENDTENSAVEIKVVMDKELRDKLDSIQKHFEGTIGFKPTSEQLFLFMMNMTHKTIFKPYGISSTSVYATTTLG